MNNAEKPQLTIPRVISRFSSQNQITMEILIFENTPFREIPEQDNPYYDKEDTTECLVISRVHDYVPTFEVSHISKDKNLTVLGVFFYNIKYAQTFADAVSQNDL